MKFELPPQSAPQSRGTKVSSPDLTESTTPSATSLVQSAPSVDLGTEFPSPIPLTTDLGKFRILLAEDNAINQELIRLMITKIGCLCDVAANGQIVIEMLAKQPYDLILMDCQMPVLDGYQTTRTIRQQDRSHHAQNNIIIIGLTAYAMEADRDKCLDAGMNDYLAKPCTFLELQDVIYKWMNYAAPSSQLEEGLSTLPLGHQI